MDRSRPLRRLRGVLVSDAGGVLVGLVATAASGFFMGLFVGVTVCL